MRLTRISIGVITLVVLCIYGESVWAADKSETIYAGRWRVTEIAPGVVTPPLKLLWKRSPAWFPSRNRGGPREADVRRLAETRQGLVTLINRTFYLLDKATGRTLWSHPLQGELGVSDWKVRDDVIFYAARDWDMRNKRYLRGAIDVAQRKALWENALTDDLSRYIGGGSAEWVLPLPDQQVLYSTEYSDPFFLGPLDFLNIQDGYTRLSMEKEFNYLQDVVLSWFAYKEDLYVFLKPKSAGVQLHAYNPSRRKKQDPLHVYGDKTVAWPFPFLVQEDGTTVLVYEPMDQSSEPKLIAYSLGDKKLLWDMPLTLEANRSIRLKNLMYHPGKPRLLAATTEPNGYVVIDTERQRIIKHGELGNNEKWAQSNSGLYSYPYIFGGIERQVGKEKKYDLIALNVETGKVEWSYEYRAGGWAEILSFVVSGDKLYLSRSDGLVMAFQVTSSIQR